MWPRRAMTSPMRGPSGSPSRATEPSESGSGAWPSPTLASSIRISPSMTRANSSWAQVRHSEVPSARIASSTYWRFLPTATFSYGREREARSEEHTSELQSPDHLVCRLLLEKKKNKRGLRFYQYQVLKAAVLSVCHRQAISCCHYAFVFFFFNDTATTEIYTLSLHDALPIWRSQTSNSRACAWSSHCCNRSEEHTSELQSPDHLVCRLLLEKKKTTTKKTSTTKSKQQPTKKKRTYGYG